jgi:hypothetical protein
VLTISLDVPRLQGVLINIFMNPKFEQLPVFIHIPKTAGKSIQSWIVSNVNSPDDKKILMPGHQLFSDYIKNDNKPTWSFTVIRNTYNRLVSLFDFSYRKVAIRINKQIKRTGTFDFKSNEGLIYVLANQGIVAFFDYFKNSSNPYHYPLFESQVSYSRGVDHLLRFEYLEDDFSIIQDLLGCHAPLDQRKNVRGGDKSQYFTKDFIKMVEKYYGDELEEFKFQIPND